MPRIQSRLGCRQPRRGSPSRSSTTVRPGVGSADGVVSSDVLMTADASPRVSCTTAIAGSKTSRPATRSTWPKPASSPRSVASATAMITCWPRALSACSRLRSSAAAGHSNMWKPSSSPPLNGWTGSTTAASSSRSATSLPPRPRSATMPRRKHSLWRPDSHQTASGKPGAVHSRCSSLTTR